MRYILSLMFILFSVALFAQTSINDFKYVVVPKSYNFSKEQDQYQLNSLSKFLFEKHGFTVIMEGENYPTDLAKDRCMALYANAVSDSGLFVTKVSIELLDCNGDLIYITDEGSSKDKRKEQAYVISTREAFKSLESLNYSYSGKNSVNKTTVQANITVEVNESVSEVNIKEKEEKKKDPTNTVIENVVDSKTKPVALNYKRGDAILSLHKTKNGFELLNSNANNKLEARLLESSKKNIYHYLSETNIKGIAYFDKSENLIVEYLDADNVLVTLSYTL